MTGIPRACLDSAGELEVRRDRGAHRRDHARQRLVAGHVALDDADEVDALGDDTLGDLDAVVVLQAAVGVLVERHPDTDDEVRPGRFAHCPDNPQREPKSVLEAAHPVLVVAVIGQRGPERVEQMGVGLEFDAVETRLAASGRRVGVCAARCGPYPKPRRPSGRRGARAPGSPTAR